MKKTELERKLSQLRWSFKRHGGGHDIWHNGKGQSEVIPRHSEVNELLAQKILRKAEKYPG